MSLMSLISLMTKVRYIRHIRLISPIRLIIPINAAFLFFFLKYLCACDFITIFAPFSGMRGFGSPSFYFKYPFMIDKNVVRELVDEWLQDKEYFLVDIEISPNDKIVVEIDHADGVWIEDCVQLSRFIEDRLSREEEDYELEVGSAGLGQPFKVPQQYVNFIGKEVEVLDAGGKKHRGVLKAVDGSDFTLTVKEKVKKEGAKRPVLTDVDKTFGMNDVKYTKYLISFK